MKRCLISFLVAISLITGLLHGEVSPDKRQAILHMMEITGVVKTLDSVSLQLLNQMQAQMPNQSEDFWKGVMKKLDTKELTERLVKVYDKYYTMDDLKEMNAFYDGPIGQKMMKSTPMIMSESNTIARNWIENIRQETQNEAKPASSN